MGFLDQLKSQASAAQAREGAQLADVAANTAETEAACRIAYKYLDDLAQQLNVLAPPGPVLSVDGKTPFPPMKLCDFRADARKKQLRNAGVFDYIALGWRILPKAGAVATASVTVNFPPDLERAQSRISAGALKFERKEIRHPEKNTLQAYVFEYETESRGNVTIRPDHDKAALAFRVVNASGFGVQSVTLRASRVDASLLDELAKLLLGQPNAFG